VATLAKASNPELASLATEFGQFVTYTQAAGITTASVRTLKRLTSAGDLPCYRIGRARALRLRTADVVALIERVA